MSNDPTAKYAALFEATPSPKKARAHMSRRDPATGLKEVRKVSIFFAEGDCAYREAVRPYLQNNAKGWQGALERLIVAHVQLQTATSSDNECTKLKEQVAEQAEQIAEQEAQIKVLEGILDRALAAKIGGQS